MLSWGSEGYQNDYIVAAWCVQAGGGEGRLPHGPWGGSVGFHSSGMSTVSHHSGKSEKHSKSGKKENRREGESQSHKERERELTI